MKNVPLRLLTMLIGLLAACSSSIARTPESLPPGRTPTAVQWVSTRMPVEKGVFFQVTPETLAAMLDTKSFFFVNTHTPYEGELEQTDAFILFDQITLHLDQLPTDKSAPVVLYCRSGRMSAIAARDLVNAGYTNVWDLAGGMLAWEKAGYEMIHK